MHDELWLPAESTIAALGSVSISSHSLAPDGMFAAAPSPAARELRFEAEPPAPGQDRHHEDTRRHDLEVPELVSATAICV